MSIGNLVMGLKQTLEVLLGVYLKIAYKKEFVPEVEKIGVIEQFENNSDRFDHIAYHVETLGENIEGYKEIAHLFL